MFEPVQLGRYDCYERVGATAYGEVLRARVVGAAVEKHFIVRRLVGALADDVNARRRFVLAATALMPIEDSRLVGVIEARDVPGGDCFAAMEDVRGIALELLLPITPDGAAWVIQEVGQALATLSSRKRAHGALTAANVLITAEGEVKLADAGLQVALRGEMVTADADIQALAALGKQFGSGGNAAKGRAELAARVQKMLEPAPAPAKAPTPAPATAAAAGAGQPAGHVEIPVTTGRVVKVPPRPLWLKVAPVVALAGIGVAAWRLAAQHKAPTAIAAAPQTPTPTPTQTPTPTPPPPAPKSPVPKPEPTPIAKTSVPPPPPEAVPILQEPEAVPGARTGKRGHTADPELRVRCHARGLRVLVDGRDTGVRCPADYRRIRVAVGEHTVAIVRGAGGAPVAQHTIKVHPQNRATRVYFKD